MHVILRRATRPLPSILLLAALLACLLAGAALADERSDVPDESSAKFAWAAVARGEAVVLMRHALAPGTGDPSDFDIDDCRTQRNLSGAGREQARRIGAHVAKALGSSDVDVLSSAWCRCLDTARLLGLGEVQTLPALNSFFRRRESAEARTAELRRWIDERIARADGSPAVLVTHQVNVTALNGGFVASGEIVIVDAEGTILARVALP